MQLGIVNFFRNSKASEENFKKKPSKLEGFRVFSSFQDSRATKLQEKREKRSIPSKNLPRNTSFPAQNEILVALNHNQVN